MEMLVIMEQYRDEFCSRVITLEPARFGNPPIKEARGKKNRFSFRPTPLEISSIPVHRVSSADFNNPPISTTARTAPIPINPPVCVSDSIDLDEQSCYNYKSLSFPELWAGPTYSNSPPASSLPIPKFSIRQTRTVSLELPPDSAAESVKIHPIVKSAPPSPTRGHKNHHINHHPSTREPFHGADSATRTLRRILNLAIDSE
ncbi:uncharacterized protein LOC111018396 [Momordica charantia]|uniref:Uncharacterized protein LOC111018396 n=1 Tax=Momordica charantia TaxID=3673 RepID=A0A6J1D941_MOMCH|nr:uncharacterized protein LOC111018396 [Momordica charantia]XP_022150144.1 uncharacterized protein LOC111018396 [Momordica charantia]